MGQEWRQQVSTEERPFEVAETVVPSDVTNLLAPTRGLYVGGAGAVVAIMNGVAITFVGVPAGTVLPVVVTRVNATGTTATSIVALS